MNYTEAKQYLIDTSKYGSVLGLANMRALLSRLDNPEQSLRYIHIAGTNGKGSVLAYLSTILKVAGYKVGRYISPTLFSDAEKIQVNEKAIEPSSLAEHLTFIAKAVTEMVAAGLPHPTLFEIETALAFLHFKALDCDLVVLETGLGGLEDATNVIPPPELTILTPISMDHMAVLGDTLTAIAAVKAGIIKDHTVVLSASQDPAVMAVIAAKCEQTNSQLIVCRDSMISEKRPGYHHQLFNFHGTARNDYLNLKISLGGNHQFSNAALAVAAIESLRQHGYQITDEQLRQGLKETQWPGRFTVLSEEPIFIIDGAHNVAAAQSLKESLELYFQQRTMHFIIGIFKDKEYASILSMLAPMAADILTIATPDNPRALSAEALAAEASKYNRRVTPYTNIREAVITTLERAGKNDVIVAFGSLSFLGEITKYEKEARRK